MLFKGPYVSLLLFILVTVRDSIDALFWIVLLFLFELNWVVLSNNSNFVRKIFFCFLYYFLSLFFFAVPIRYLNLSPYMIVGLWYLLRTLFFIFNIFVLLFLNESIFRSYDDSLEACILVSELLCFWLVLIFGGLMFIGDGKEILFFAISILLLSFYLN